MRSALVAIILLSLSACGQDDGPAVPNAKVSGANGEANPGQPGSENEGAGGSTDPRLSTLPLSLQKEMVACEATGHFYDLGQQACSSTLPAAIDCTLNDAFRDLLDPTTVEPFNDYVKTKASDLTLYACTEAGINLVLHFYKFENGVVQYRKLNIAKKN